MLTFGGFIAAARRDKVKLSRADLAKRFGVSVQTIHGWETDEYKPGKARLPQLARELGVPVKALMDLWHGEPSPQSTADVNDSSTLEAGSSTPDDATGEQETMLNEDAVTAFEILRELPPDQYQATLAAARRARGKGGARPHRRA